MLAQAGIDPKSLGDLDWNPNDGGSFGRVIAKLSIDAAGKSGLDPGFDPKNVQQYGLLLNGLADGLGHEEWANFAASLGWNYCDAPWATHFYYDDAKLVATIQWFADLSLRKGFIVPTKDARQAAATGLFAAQKGALALTGSWLVHWFTENCKFEIGFAPLPKGPVGRRTVINGLADSIWAGSKHQEEAWRWVKFLASPEAQKIVASYGIVFPAVPEATEIAKTRMDVSAFWRKQKIRKEPSSFRSLTMEAMWCGSYELASTPSFWAALTSERISRPLTRRSIRYFSRSMTASQNELVALPSLFSSSNFSPIDLNQTPES
jgi:multiple sugar transport system substrate-binding protein